MRALVIGDIGVLDGMFHVGDEAMFEVAVAELARRGVDAIGVSAAPDESAARYDIPTVPRLGFRGLDRAHAAARADALLAGRVPVDDSARATLDALDGSAGLVIAGGGNLASRWPEHIVERATLAELARRRGLPVVVSGQTLGPDLDGGDAAVVRDLVGAAAAVRMREPDSRDLVVGWGIPARLGVDDASFLDNSPAGGGGIVVSLSGWFAGRDTSETEADLAAALDILAGETGMPVSFHAHFAALDAEVTRGDSAVHARVAALMSTPSRVLPTRDSRSSAAIARRADLLVSSRYHPVVFAAPAGVPILALTADRYTEIKLRGALGHWGDVEPISLASGARALASHGLAVAARRDAIARDAATAGAAHVPEAAAWWDDVARALGA